MARPGTIAALVLVVAGVPGQTATRAAASVDPAADVGTAPAATLPVTRVHRYRMAGRIRPLLFWMGRDRVGLARITWHEGAGGALGFELLVGTDPAVAPRGINRWGYIAEERREGDGSVLALMSRSDEASLDEVAARTTAPAEGEFKVMHGWAEGGMAGARVTRVRPPFAPTIHDVEKLLPLVRVHVAEAAVRSRVLDAATRPGFLGTVAELIARTSSQRLPRAGTTADADARAAERGATPVPYVFAQSLYTLRLASAERVRYAVSGDKAPVAASRDRFEITNLGTGRRTEFEVVHGLDGDLAGVPLFIAWQPRWWLKVELHLED